VAGGRRRFPRGVAGGGAGELAGQAETLVPEVGQEVRVQQTGIVIGTTAALLGVSAAFSARSAEADPTGGTGGGWVPGYATVRQVIPAVSVAPTRRSTTAVVS
jgi:hypothetical protein